MCQVVCRVVKNMTTVLYGSLGDKEIEEVLDYLSNNDAEGLKSMFCEIIKSSTNFDEQIQEALDFFKERLFLIMIQAEQTAVIQE